MFQLCLPLSHFLPQLYLSLFLFPPIPCQLLLYFSFTILSFIQVSLALLFTHTFLFFPPLYGFVFFIFNSWKHKYLLLWIHKSKICSVEWQALKVSPHLYISYSNFKRRYNHRSAATRDSLNWTRALWPILKILKKKRKKNI